MLSRDAARAILVLGLLVGCREKPFPMEDRSAGVSAMFPGQARTNTFTEPTPFGDMEWFSTEYTPSGRLDEAFFVQVGNLPAGVKGGTTAMEVMATYKKFLEYRLGKLEVTTLPASTGPGFRYLAKVPSGAFVEGMVVFRRARIHRAQATSSRSTDPTRTAFLDSFRVN